MTTPADRTIHALRTGHDDLARRVEGLSPEGLRAPSAAAEWNVAQVLSHLGSGAEIALAALEGARGGAVPGPDFNPQVWDRWNAMTPDEQAAGFLRADEALVAAYESLDEATRRDLRIDLGFLPEPVEVATAAGFRLNEFALHHWDVEVTFDPKAVVSADAAPLLTDRIAFLLRWVAHPEHLGRPASVLVRLTEPASSFGLQLADTATLGDVPENPGAVLVAPTEAWIRLATGRLRPEHTPADVTVSGELTLDDLRRVFPGF
jgi:uncharacterized protein (TIGR03083 family)